MLSDLRFALRTARKSPGPALTAICTLVLGIGANTAMFSIASGVLLRPLPFAQPDRLVQLRESDGFNTAGTSAVYYSDLDSWRKRSRSFESMAAYGNISRNLEDVPDPERLAAVWAERGLFRMLGVEPLAGRTFRDDDPPDVVVIAEGLWRRRFGAEPSSIGRSITLDGQPYTVIGVMSEAFQFPYRASRTDVWIPWSVPPQYAGNPGYRVDFAAGRLRPGVTVDSALRELAVIANPARRAIVTPLSEMVPDMCAPSSPFWARWGWCC